MASSNKSFLERPLVEEYPTFNAAHRRRPQTTDPCDPWICPPSEWQRLIRDDQAMAIANRARRLSKLNLAGRLAETTSGMTVTPPCLGCRAAGMVCRKPRCRASGQYNAALKCALSLWYDRCCHPAVLPETNDLASDEIIVLSDFPAHLQPRTQGHRRARAIPRTARLMSYYQNPPITQPRPGLNTDIGECDTNAARFPSTPQIPGNGSYLPHTQPITIDLTPDPSPRERPQERARQVGIQQARSITPMTPAPQRPAQPPPAEQPPAEHPPAKQPPAQQPALPASSVLSAQQASPHASVLPAEPPTTFHNALLCSPVPPLNGVHATYDELDTCIREGLDASFSEYTAACAAVPTSPRETSVHMEKCSAALEKLRAFQAVEAEFLVLRDGVKKVEEEFVARIRAKVGMET